MCYAQIKAMNEHYITSIARAYIKRRNSEQEHVLTHDGFQNLLDIIGRNISAIIERAKLDDFPCAVWSIDCTYYM